MRFLTAAICCCSLGLLLTTPATALGKIPKGAFIQLDDGENGNAGWSEVRWRQELEWMRQLGMDTVILSDTVRVSKKRQQKLAFYPTKLEGLKAVSSQPIKWVFAAATAGKMQVYLGLVADDTWWEFRPEAWEDKDQQALDRMATLSIAVARELHGLYGNEPTLKGFYVPQEIDNRTWVKKGHRETLVRDFLNPVGKAVKKLPGKSPWEICIAPFFNVKCQPSDEFGLWWKQTLTDVPEIDLILLQDGVGTIRKTSQKDVQKYFQSLKKALPDAKRHLWADLEVFEETEPEKFKPGDIKRIVEQLQTEKDLSEELVCWEFSHYLSPGYSIQALHLFLDYERQIRQSRPPLRNVALGKEYRVSTPPSAQYPDPKGRKLTDGETKYDLTSAVGWEKPQTVAITIDLGVEVDRITDLCLYNIQDTRSSVSSPRSVKIAVSGDGKSFAPSVPLSAVASDDKSLNLWYGRLKADTKGRFIRYEVDSPGAWLMVSELGVFAE